MKNFLILLIILSISSCSNVEQIGNYQYNIKISRANSGEFEALIFKYKQYYIKEKQVFSILQTAQKLHFEKQNDTVFAFGTIKIKNENNKILIYAKENYINKYEIFVQADSVVRIYEQQDNGLVKFKKIIYYRNGIKNVFIDQLQ